MSTQQRQVSLHYCLENWQKRLFQKQQRLYEISCAQDIWGQWMVFRRYRSAGWKSGRCIQEAFPTYTQAYQRFQSLCRYRQEKRGYLPRSVN